MQQSELSFRYYSVQKDTHISSEDLSNLRELYGSILGPCPIFLYESLLDFVKGANMRQSTCEFRVLSVYLNMTVEQLEDARIKLEAIGLLNTYFDNKKLITVFSLQKPLDAMKLKKNDYISKLIISKIGKPNFKDLIKHKSNNIHILNSSQYEDVSANFFEVFNDDSNKETLTDLFIKAGKAKRNEQQSSTLNRTMSIPLKLNIGHVQYNNEYEAILKLSAKDFLLQILERELNDDEINYLNKWSNVFEDAKAINLISYLAFINNNKKWLNQAQSWMNEVYERSLVEFNDLENYLDQKFSFFSQYKTIYETKQAIKQSYLSSIDK
ncbi:hypothetical protein GE118_00100 [Mycoplasma sp. NEAQ87857]|uniref:hypothetical protein n=1 Tax=Mycoplasma sp. NEAQ87857 TaxID=2683967 RepID=UPI001317C9AA|nr:hypothetical protein [Mycoplasma sp. NEAQ87857]QGZ97204.1 hypothetical protein GE118_00100 [Mycoplasma sp. NEAQ87857]